MGCSCNKNPCACTPIDTGGCCTTSTSSTCCTPVVAKPVVTTDCPTAPVRMGVEDLTFGCEVEVQLRHCTNVKVTQIHSDHILYCPTGRPISYYLGELIRMFPYIECQMGRPTMDYGVWDDAVIVCEVSCCVEGMDPTVEQRLTFNEGDVVTHNGCLWISLVNDNLSEPGTSSVDACAGDGPEWLCLTSIECRLATLEECIFPAGLPSLCERVTSIEACVFPEGEATLCERTTQLESCVFPDSGPTVCERLTIIEGDIDNIPAEVHLVSGTRNGDDSITLTMNNGQTILIPAASEPAPPETNPGFVRLPARTLLSTGELATSDMSPANVSIPVSGISGLPADFSQLVLRTYIELDSLGPTNEPTGLRLIINGDMVGTAEGGGPSGNIVDSFSANDAFINNAGANVNIETVLAYGGNGYTVYQVNVSVIGYFK